MEEYQFVPWLVPTSLAHVCQIHGKPAAWDFPSSLEVKTSPSSVGDVSSIPGQGAHPTCLMGKKNEAKNGSNIVTHPQKDFKNGPHQNKKQHPAASHYLSRGKKAGAISEPHGSSRAQPVGKQEPAGNIIDLLQAEIQ